MHPSVGWVSALLRGAWSLRGNSSPLRARTAAEPTCVRGTCQFLRQTWGGGGVLKVLVHEITQEKGRRCRKQGRENHGLQRGMKNDSWLHRTVSPQGGRKMLGANLCGSVYSLAPRTRGNNSTGGRKEKEHPRKTVPRPTAPAPNQARD